VSCCQEILPQCTTFPTYLKLTIFAQVLQPSAQVGFAGLADHIICTEAYKMGILAQNVLAPGFISFIDVITTSISEVSRRMFVSREGEKKCSWLEEYSQGCVMEIYTIPLAGDVYKNASFETVCAAVRREYGACLFALVSYCLILGHSA
jgi:hypothetical protein